MVRQKTDHVFVLVKTEAKRFCFEVVSVYMRAECVHILISSLNNLPILKIVFQKIKL